ncbi:2,3-diaminopropionate biosynthesis protein SbnB [Streptomyces sp. NPDC058398]|uniref:2,3-diaminopropionate biosynthesis protein SbnB n=1 Tax=Streptomyces sp. NPDC058398 TaxID=3346479 RepID=UPI003649BE6A
MLEPQAVPAFSVIPGATVHRMVEGRHQELLRLVEDTYRAHGTGRTVNPPSYFLRFPDRPTARIIALPASLAGESSQVDGMKWISSFPANLDRGLPRASAVLILNDPVTGYPYACLESSIISAVRTAASAALAAQKLAESRTPPRRVGFFGTGLIARYLHEYLAALGWDIDEWGLYDLSDAYSRSFAAHLNETDPDVPVRVHDSAESLIRSCDLVVFATTAAAPHVTDPDWFAHHPLVLHVSLRDLSPDIVLDSVNVVDDIEHVLKADTSVHLAEQRTGHRDFLDATLFDLLAKTFQAPADRTVVFSPFGLGVLDLAVGNYVHRRAAELGELSTVDGFFHDVRRHSRPDRASGPA